MIQISKLTQFYISQYEAQIKKRQKNPVNYKDFNSKVEKMAYSLRQAKASRLNSAMLEEYHRQLKNMASYAYRKRREDALRQIKEEMIPKLVKLDLDFLLPEQRENIDDEFLVYMRHKLYGKICRYSLFTLFPIYREYQIKNQIVDLVPTRPELEFPDALEMKRHFIIHIGPTNSGKTFRALERLKTAENGVYLGPLRLLALEVYEKMHDYGVPCTMLTGQECIDDPESRIVASTVEMADLDIFYDIAVIDEAQMMADPDRGHSWTRAILGLQAREIHICTSPVAEPVLLHLIELCHDTYEINRYERKTALEFEDTSFSFPGDVRDGDALIVFSKKSVLDVAGRLEEQGIKVSIIYGSLPPEVRRKQMHMFTSGKTRVVVSTDAIGMGLNLPVERIVFLESSKFDGVIKRPLTTPEIRQIAGRAGRFGLYNTGYINVLGDEELLYVRERYFEEESDMETVNLGFPQVLLDIAEPLNEILTVWHSVAPEPPFEKENIDEAMFLYDRAYKVKEYIYGFEDKRTLYKMITCPIDIKDHRVVSLWLDYCMSYTADVSLRRPRLDERDRGGIMKYETYYKQLDLYYQFSKRMGKIIEEDWLRLEREKTEANIMRLLSKGKENFMARCPYCAKLLPFGYPYRICQECYGDEREDE